MTVRLPSALEVAALLRQVAQGGGFATVLAKGEADAGAILVVITHRGANARVYERMPSLDGTRPWRLAQGDDSRDGGTVADYLARRRKQDSDLWMVELDIAKGERFIGIEPSPD